MVGMCGTLILGLQPTPRNHKTNVACPHATAGVLNSID